MSKKTSESNNKRNYFYLENSMLTNKNEDVNETNKDLNNLF